MPTERFDPSRARDMLRLLHDLADRGASSGWERDEAQQAHERLLVMLGLDDGQRIADALAAAPVPSQEAEDEAREALARLRADVKALDTEGLLPRVARMEVVRLIDAEADRLAASPEGDRHPDDLSGMRVGGPESTAFACNCGAEAGSYCRTFAVGVGLVCADRFDDQGSGPAPAAGCETCAARRATPATEPIFPSIPAVDVKTRHVVHVEGEWRTVYAVRHVGDPEDEPEVWVRVVESERAGPGVWLGPLEEIVFVAPTPPAPASPSTPGGGEHDCGEVGPDGQPCRGCTPGTPEGADGGSAGRTDG